MALALAVLAAWKNRLPLTAVLGAGKGIARALNAGLQACTGDVIARIVSPI